WVVAVQGAFEERLRAEGDKLKKLQPGIPAPEVFENTLDELSRLKDVFRRLGFMADACRRDFDLYRFASAMTSVMFSDIARGDRFTGRGAFYFDKYIPVFAEPDPDTREGFSASRLFPVTISRGDVKNPLYLTGLIRDVIARSLLQSSPLTGEIAKVVSRFFGEERNLENVNVNRSDAVRIVFSYADAITLDICATLVLADSYAKAMLNGAHPFTRSSFNEMTIDPSSRTGISHTPPLILRCAASIKCLEWMGIKSEAHGLRQRLSVKIQEYGGSFTMTDDFQSMRFRLPAEPFIRLFEMIIAEMLSTSFDSLDGMTLPQIFGSGRGMAVRETCLSALKSFAAGSAEAGHPLGLLQAAATLAAETGDAKVGELLFASVLRKEAARARRTGIPARAAIESQETEAEDFAGAIILAELLSKRRPGGFFRKNYEI
ncbi:MAG: hypothetical protein FJ088_02905, partial [Deltaproteobacteria bacterium]|nr:hypothetical protein [Deltaproteobacteria bacterium]